MKIAFCISGQLRTYDSVLEPLAKYIIHKYQADVFVCTWDLIGDGSDRKISTQEVKKYTMQKSYCEIMG